MQPALITLRWYAIPSQVPCATSLSSAQKKTLFAFAIDNVRLYTGLVQELHDLIGRLRLVGLHYRLGGSSRLNVRWGAVLPLSIECHPPAQATRFGTLGTDVEQCPSSLASLGVCIPTMDWAWTSSRPIASRVASPV